MTEHFASPGAELREELSEASPFSLFLVREWVERFPGLRAGITSASSDSDFAVVNAPSEAHVRDVYERLGAQLGFSSQAVARQVHGTRVMAIGRAQRRGLQLVGEADGLVCGRSGVLCCVTAADCVPIFVLDTESGAIALLHGGWRGVAAGILEAGVDALATRYGARPEALVAHFGPAICGECYQVGPEVISALGGAAPGQGAATVDLRAELGRRALRLGLRHGAITSSSWCTRCNSDLFHSHRSKGLEAGRMAAFIGWYRLAEP